MRNRLRILTIALFSLASVPVAAQIDSTAQVRNAPMLDYEHPKQYIINKVKVSGIKYLDPEVVASMSGLTKGDTIMIPSDYLSSTLKTMWNQRIYSDVQILTGLRLEDRGCPQGADERVARNAQAEER